MKSDTKKIKSLILDNINDKMKILELHTNSITNDKYRVIAKINAENKYLSVINNITNILLDNNVLSASWENEE